MDWQVAILAIPALLVGVWATIRVCVVAIVFGTIIGLVVGLASLSHFAPTRLAAKVYVEFIRATPLLIQLLLVYFALPAAGIELSAFWAGVVALSMNAGGFIAESVRGAIGGIDPGQAEAAKSIGMTHGETLRIILLPQAARSFLPPLTNELISLIKNSALLSVISVYELTRSGQEIIALHFTPVTIYLLIAVYYYVLITAVATLSRFAERRMPA